MKKHLNLLKKAAALSLSLSLLLSFPAMAAWENEHLGPGAAQWIEEQTPEGNASQQPAPDAESHFDVPEDHSVTYIDGQPVSLTNPDGTTEAISLTPQAPPADTAGEPSAPPAAEDASTPPAAETAPAETTPAGTGTEAPQQQTPETTGEAAQTEDPAAVPEAAAEDPNIVTSGGRQLDLRKPMIALTYDDGPYAPVGNKIMDVLEQFNGRATFFMVGDRVRSYSTEVKRMVSNGHEVANHTYNHKYLNKLDAASIRSQVEQCNQVIQEVTGVRPSLMRLPGGNQNATVRQNIGMPIILWNIDTRDWATKNAQKTIDAVLGKVKDGDIVLMHELYSSTADATATFVPQLAAQGFQFVTVSELAQFKGKDLTANQVYYSIR